MEHECTSMAMHTIANYTNPQQCKPHGGATGKVKGFILWELWMSI